jgi:hypothetical protein
MSGKHAPVDVRVDMVTSTIIAHAIQKGKGSGIRPEIFSSSISLRFDMGKVARYNVRLWLASREMQFLKE